jgi:catechol 2,3-dioxygenase-like lactoylglutathione lyase family enzyme
MAITGVSHIGICVRELERLLRFYCDVLGFEIVTRIPGVEQADVARLLELRDLDMGLVFVERDGMRIELIAIANPAPTGGGKGVFNGVGFTHLSVKVADFDAELARMRKLGVELLEHTIGASTDSNARFAFVLDPDGNRIELFGAIDEAKRKPCELD